MRGNFPYVMFFLVILALIGFIAWAAISHNGGCPDGTYLQEYDCRSVTTFGVNGQLAFGQACAQRCVPYGHVKSAVLTPL